LLAVVDGQPNQADPFGAPGRAEGLVALADIVRAIGEFLPSLLRFFGLKP
jgi:hypothetical protein